MLFASCSSAPPPRPEHPPHLLHECDWPSQRGCRQGSQAWLPTLTTFSPLRLTGRQEQQRRLRSTPIRKGDPAFPQALISDHFDGVHWSRSMPGQTWSQQLNCAVSNSNLFQREHLSRSHCSSEALSLLALMWLI